MVRDLIQELEGYGHAAEALVPPVALDELSDRAGGAVTGERTGPTRATRGPWSGWIVAAATSVVVVVLVGGVAWLWRGVGGEVAESPAPPTTAIAVETTTTETEPGEAVTSSVDPWGLAEFEMPSTQAQVTAVLLGMPDEIAGMVRRGDEGGDHVATIEYRGAGDEATSLFAQPGDSRDRTLPVEWLTMMAEGEELAITSSVLDPASDLVWISGSVIPQEGTLYFAAWANPESDWVFYVEADSPPSRDATVTAFSEANRNRLSASGDQEAKAVTPTPTTVPPGSLSDELIVVADLPPMGSWEIAPIDLEFGDPNSANANAVSVHFCADPTMPEAPRPWNLVATPPMSELGSGPVAVVFETDRVGIQEVIYADTALAVTAAFDSIVSSLERCLDQFDPTFSFTDDAAHEGWHWEADRLDMLLLGDNVYAIQFSAVDPDGVEGSYQMDHSLAVVRSGDRLVVIEMNEGYANETLRGSEFSDLVNAAIQRLAT